MGNHNWSHELFRGFWGDFPGDEESTWLRVLRPLLMPNSPAKIDLFLASLEYTGDFG